MKDSYKFDCPNHYIRLTGGVGVFLRGYIHHKDYHTYHKDTFQAINKNAAIICIEGITNVPFGESLDLYWSDPNAQFGHYDALMKEAVISGFDGFFAEIDARDTSKFSMDDVSFLPRVFFNKYFAYLVKIEPSLMKKINSPEKLKEVLMRQSNTEKGVLSRGFELFDKGLRYYETPYLANDGKTSPHPTGLEFGQLHFTDALAATKLHLIARLMSDGHIPNGPIIDYQGIGHLSNRSYYLQFPQYAMQVVLRSIHELMAGSVNELTDIYCLFDNPDWAKITKEILKLPFKKIEV